MSSNHPELMRTYPNPLLDFIPLAEQYAIERSQASLNRSCSGLHFPHVLAPWGLPQYSAPYPNYSDREGTISSGPVSERVPQNKLHCDSDLLFLADVIMSVLTVSVCYAADHLGMGVRRQGQSHGSQRALVSSSKRRL